MKNEMFGSVPGYNTLASDLLLLTPYDKRPARLVTLILGQSDKDNSLVLALAEIGHEVEIVAKSVRLDHIDAVFCEATNCGGTSPGHAALAFHLLSGRRPDPTSDDGWLERAAALLKRAGGHREVTITDLARTEELGSHGCKLEALERLLSRAA